MNEAASLRPTVLKPCRRASCSGPANPLVRARSLPEQLMLCFQPVWKGTRARSYDRPAGRRTPASAAGNRAERPRQPAHADAAQIDPRLPDDPAAVDVDDRARGLSHGLRDLYFDA